MDIGVLRIEWSAAMVAPVEPPPQPVIAATTTATPGS
jgi:hypothetical protein